MCTLCNISIGDGAALKQSDDDKLVGESIYLVRTEQKYVLEYEGVSFDVNFCPMCGRSFEERVE